MRQCLRIWANNRHLCGRTASTMRRHSRPPPLALRRPRGPGWQESRRMHPHFAECAKWALFLATSARNACFSRSRWQHLRPMHSFPGAIGRFRIHGARILPPRGLFRVEGPEIMHGAKMLPAPSSLSAAAACGPAERALRSGTPSSLAACAGLCHLARAAPPPLRCPCPRTLPRTHRASCWPTRVPPPRRAGSAAVPAIPAK